MSNTSRSPEQEANRVYNCDPTGLHVFLYIKSSYLRVWLLISLKLAAN